MPSSAAVFTNTVAVVRAAADNKGTWTKKNRHQGLRIEAGPVPPKTPRPKTPRGGARGARTLLIRVWTWGHHLLLQHPSASLNPKPSVCTGITNPRGAHSHSTPPSHGCRPLRNAGTAPKWEPRACTPRLLSPTSHPAMGSVAGSRPCLAASSAHLQCPCHCAVLRLATSPPSLPFHFSSPAQSHLVILLRFNPPSVCFVGSSIRAGP